MLLLNCLINQYFHIKDGFYDSTVINVSINNRIADGLIDCGSSYVTIFRSRTALLELGVDLGKSYRKYVIKDINGNVSTGDLYLLKELRIGNFIWKNILCRIVFDSRDYDIILPHGLFCGMVYAFDRTEERDKFILISKDNSYDRKYYVTDKFGIKHLLQMIE